MIGRQDFFARARNASSHYSTEQLYAAYETYLTCPLSPFREERGTLTIDCGRCGNCCRRPWRVEAHLRDVLRWAAEGRHDIMDSLESRPRMPGTGYDSSSSMLRQLASLLAGTDEDVLARVMSVAWGAETCPGSYVLPKKRGCCYLIDVAINDGATTACGIYETRPEVCQRFPEID
jgi:Fe-S-cluster containining protein